MMQRDDLTLFTELGLCYHVPKQPECALQQKSCPSFKIIFFIFLFLTSSIDLFAGSKKVFIEETRAAQEDRLNFAQVSGVQEPSAATPVMNEEQWLMTIYLKGKEYYDQGDYQASIAEWNKANGVVDRYPAFKTVIDYLRGREKALSQEAVRTVDKRLEERRRQIEQIFQSGKSFYDKGNMDKAILEWDKLGIYLPEDAPHRRLISDLKSYYSQSQMGPKQSDPMTKEFSADMLRFFASASDLYQVQAQQAKSALASAENAQEAVGSGFQRAKLLYYEGNYDEAIQELEKIKTFFKDNSAERQSLENLIQIYHQAQGEKEAAAQAMKGKNIKVKSPADFSKFIEEVHEKFKVDLKEAETQRSTQERSFEDRQSWMSSDFEKGVQLYKEGKTDAALMEWEQVAPNFENEQTVRQLIDKVKKHVSEIEKIRLDQEKALKEKQALINGTLERGRLLYEAGKYEQAVEEWNKISSYFADPDRFQKFVQVMGQVHKDTVKVQQVRQQAEAAANTKINSPDSLITILGEAKERLNKESEAAAIEKQKAEKAEQTKELIRKTMDAGRALLSEGKFDEAIQEWSKLKSAFADPAKFEEFLRMMDGLQREAVTIHQQKEAALASSNVKFQTPDDLKDILGMAQGKLKAETSEVETLKQKAEKTQQTQELIQKTIASGRALAQSGKIDEAVKEWSKIASLFEDADKFQAFIKSMTDLNTAINSARASREESLARSGIKFKTPAELSQILGEAGATLKEKTDAATLAKAQAEQALADRENLVRKTVSNGKLMLESGNWQEAIKAWRELKPILEDGDKLEENLSSLEANYETRQKAEMAAREAELNKDNKVATPAEMSDLLRQAARQIELQTESVQSKKRKADQAFADRQIFTSEGYEKGKAYLAEGKYGEAFQQWEKIMPNLDEAVTLKPLLDKTGAYAQTLMSAQKAASEAELKKDSKLKTPADLGKLLESALLKIQTETEMAKTKRGTAEEGYASRESMVQNTFEKGKKIYEAGQYSEALDVWKIMLSELQDADKVRASIRQIEEAYAKLIESRRQSDDSEKKLKAGVATPAAFGAMLSEIDQKLKLQIESASQRRQSADQLLKEKQAKADAIFAKGKLLYDDGKLSEAIQEWQSMLADMEDGAKVKAALDALQVSAEAVHKAEAEAEQKKDAKLSTPGEFVKTFEDISLRLDSQIQTAQVSRQKYESALNNRKTMVSQAFEEGKKLYGEGKFEEAFRSWDMMLPALEDEATARQQIEAARTAYQNLALAEKAAHEAASRKEQKFKTPEGLSELLSEMSDRLKIRTVDVQGQKSQADNEFKARQSLMMATVSSGNKLYEDGRFEEAKAVWMSVLPTLEDPKDLENAIEELHKIHEQRMTVEQISKEAEALKNTKFPAPQGVTAEIVDAREKLRQQTAETEAYKRKAEQELNARQAQIQSAFEKGKTAYWEGKLGEAVQAWSSIADSLEDQNVRKSIQTVSENYQHLLDLQKTAQDAELRKDSKLKTPDELPRLLTDAKQIMTSQKTYSETQKKIADQTFVDRQALINSSFEKGKRLYNENRIPEALEEWGTITPYLEKGSELKQFILDVQEKYENSLAAKKLADEAQIKRTIKFQSPENLSSFLEEASRKLKAQADESKMKKDEAEKARADRQAFIDSNFLRGRLLYEEGKIAEAIDVWKSLLPYLQDSAKVRALIIKAEESRRALGEASLEQPVATAPKTPSGLEPLLKGANEKLQKETTQKNKAKLEEDVRSVIQDKKSRSKKTAAPKAKPTAIQPDEIEQMMIDYNIASPQELEKRHRELKAIQ